jgi:hypothetical protein
MRDTFQDSQSMPQSINCTKLFVNCFSYTSIPIIRLKYKLGTIRHQQQ